MHRLGGEADVAHHRDAAAHQAIDHGEGFRLGPLQLHRRRWRFLEHPPGGGHGVIGAALVAQEGQVADQQRLLVQGGHGRQAPAHGPAVVEHLVEGHRQGGGVAEHHHRQGVAHQHHLSARLGHQRRREGVPGGEHGKRQSRLLALGQIRRAQGHRPPTAKAIASIQTTRTHAAPTPKPGQDRKAAATRDARRRRGLRVTPIPLVKCWRNPGHSTRESSRGIP